MKKYLPIIKYLILILLLLVAGVFGLKSAEKPEVKPESAQIIKYQDFHLEIPKLNLDAPIIADVPGDDKDAYFKALESGVAHYKNTQKPGEGGNIFIFGHSSFYLWKPGDYKQIFKNLADLQKDDEIIVWYQTKKYQYKVIETKVVAPTEVNVLDPTPYEQLTLMTCVPVGTTKERLIVIAKPI